MKLSVGFTKVIVRQLFLALLRYRLAMRRIFRQVRSRSCCWIGFTLIAFVSISSTIKNRKAETKMAQVVSTSRAGVHFRARSGLRLWLDRQASRCLFRWLPRVTEGLGSLVAATEWDGTCRLAGFGSLLSNGRSASIADSVRLHLMHLTQQIFAA